MVYTIFQTSHIMSCVMTVFLVSWHKLRSVLFAISENPNWKLDLSSWLLLLDEKNVQQWPFTGSNQRYIWCHSLSPHTYNRGSLADRLFQTASSSFRGPQLWTFCCFSLDGPELLPWNWQWMIFLHSPLPSPSGFYKTRCHLSAFTWLI